MDTLRVAVIGAGGMGSGHVRTITEHPRAELVLACDVNEAALAPLAAQGVATCTDWQDALPEGQVDAAVITLPHHAYPEVVNTALARGIHVLKEKPFARDLDDARLMREAAEQSNTILMVAGQGKYSAGYQRAKQIVDSGVLGKVFLSRAIITYRWGGAIHNSWSWRGKRELSGGTAIIDSGWHILDLLTWFRGMPETVYCTVGQGNAFPGDYDVDDRALLTLEYADGSIAGVVCCFICLPNARQVFLHGTEASLDITDTCVRLHKGDQADAEVIQLAPEPNLLRPQFDHFLHLIDTHASPIAGAQEAYDIQRIIDAAYRSAQSKVPERLRD
ncbi:MAG: Gfo/Idh/MocA family oxidoreductase [Armatimonadetes bacterium]|nr:Gfo/Idh/MocA family oxidoreductase [Armatimonadota bacterium]